MGVEVCREERVWIVKVIEEFGLVEVECIKWGEIRDKDGNLCRD